MSVFSRNPFARNSAPAIDVIPPTPAVTGLRPPRMLDVSVADAEFVEIGRAATTAERFTEVPRAVVPKRTATPHPAPHAAVFHGAAPPMASLARSISNHGFWAGVVALSLVSFWVSGGHVLVGRIAGTN